MWNKRDYLFSINKSKDEFTNELHSYSNNNSLIDFNARVKFDEAGNFLLKKKLIGFQKTGYWFSGTVTSDGNEKSIISIKFNIILGTKIAIGSSFLFGLFAIIYSPFYQSTPQALFAGIITVIIGCYQIIYLDGKKNDLKNEFAYLFKLTELKENDSE